jgi:hypothetical protein
VSETAIREGGAAPPPPPPPPPAASTVRASQDARSLRAGARRRRMKQASCAFRLAS